MLSRVRAGGRIIGTRFRAIRRRGQAAGPAGRGRAADTLPSFHTNAFGGNIESTVSFYATTLFLDSPAARDLDQRFRAPVNVGPNISQIGRFLRALNVALNLDMAKQRLRASQTILNRFRDQQVTIQKELIRLAAVELVPTAWFVTRV